MTSALNYSRVTFVLFSLLLSIGVAFGKEEARTSGAEKLLSDNLGSFKAAGAVIKMFPSQSPHLFGDGAATRTYLADDGSRYDVNIQVTDNDSSAFALLTQARGYYSQLGRDYSLTFNEPGTASFETPQNVFFFKGNVFAEVTKLGNDSDRVNELARELASGLTAGEGDVPVLLKHLPDWETKAKTAVYCVSLDDLRNALRSSSQRTEPGEIQEGQPVAGEAYPVIAALDFDGGTEAVTANYGGLKLAIVEFTTPQMSIDNDSRIWTKIAELKSQGQPTPSAYRRVGNYSVFVFNAPDEKAANALIDQVKYEQVVQWLGDDPHLYDRLQKYLTQTSAGVLIAVLKSSGLSLVLCLGVGGLFGALLFRHRRAQRAAAFSDAGGSIRLNLDELTGTANTQRLLSPSNESHKDKPS